MAPPKPPSTLANEAPISTSKILGDRSAIYKTKSEDLSTGPAAYGLSLARVVRIDHIRHELDLQIMTGERDIFERTAIPNSCAAAGSRHFMGSMPECGDVCVVGWMASESKTPVVLTWVPIAATTGLEWTPVQDFLPAEVDLNPKTQAEFEGIYGRYRMKHCAVRPGCLMLSSCFGADINLDEDVLLTNRRANEIRIRDADQAIIMRSLQQFHAMGGARIYGGMVQRDAKFLPRRMMSSGINWAARTQEDENGDPLMPAQLGASGVPRDTLTPHPVFFRSDVSLPFADSGIEVEDNIDPYEFLRRGLFIGPEGVALDGSNIRSTGEYGGKPIFRVSIDTDPASGAAPTNGAIAQEGGESDTLTEYRIELDHSWDGTLPVTEQTDGFDADRLPSDAVASGSTSSGGPFLQWIVGSVVGNDPFTNRGSKLYGLPLAPHVFDVDGTVDPHMVSGIGLDLDDHAASLFQVTPPVADPSVIPPMFVSTTKDGRVKAFLSGPQNEDSLEIACNGGIRVQANGAINFELPNMDFNFPNGDPLENWGCKIQTETGGILLRASGPTTRGSFSSRQADSGLSENALPSVAIESPNGNVHLTAARIAKISGANAIQITDTNDVLIQSKQQVNTLTDKISVQANVHDKTIQGREANMYSGPKGFLPTNAPIRETKFIATPLTGHVGGNTDEYTMLFGDRNERFRLGSHKTSVFIGNQTYETILGTMTTRAGLNQITVGTADGISMFSLTNTTMTSTIATTITALASMTVKSVAITKLSGFVTTIGALGKSGRIVSSADRDPLTGRRLGTLGLGSFGHRIGAPI